MFLATVCSCLAFYSAPIEPMAVASLIAQGKTAAVRPGPGVLPVIVRLYESSDQMQRTRIAETFYQLGWKSPAAKRCCEDFHTSNQSLVCSIVGVGRVSNDDDVLAVLQQNMRTMPIRCFATKPPVLWPIPDSSHRETKGSSLSRLDSSPERPEGRRKTHRPTGAQHPHRSNQGFQPRGSGRRARK